MPCAVGGRWRSDKTAQLFSLLTKEKKMEREREKDKGFFMSKKN